MNAEARLPRLSVVIPALEEERWLPLLLADLAAQDRRADEVIVVDGGSNDRTRELATQAGATVLSSPRGVGRQRDLGGRMAKGELIVFFDADVRLEPKKTLGQLEAAFLAKKCDCACPRYRPWQSTPAIRAGFAFFDSIFRLFQYLSPSGAGCCIVVTKMHFEKSGGFRHDTVYDDIAFIRAAGRHGRFRMLPVDVFVSDRRFRKEGTLMVFGRWLALAPFFFLGIFNIERLIPYRFAHYGKQ